MAAPTFVAKNEITTWLFDNNPASSPTFSVSAGDYLFNCVAVESNLHDWVLASITDNQGTHLSWVLDEDSAGSSTSNDQGLCLIYDAGAGSAIASFNTTMTRPANPPASIFYGVACVQFRNSNGIGASTSFGSAVNATGTANITTTQDNSAVIVLITDWNASDGSSRTWATVNSITPTSGNGFELHYERNTTNAAFYLAYYPDVGTAGSKTVGITAPTSSTLRPALAAVEVKGTAGGGAATSIFIPHRMPLGS